MTTRTFLSLLGLMSVASCQREQPLSISSVGVGSLRFCEPLDRVDSLWRDPVDTSIASEGLEWPAKLVRLGDGGTILFESSWVDSSHVWRASTDARTVRSPGGIHIGLTVQDLLDRGITPTIELPEGILVLSLGTEGIEVTVDSASAARFYGSSDQTMEAVPRNATIVRLHAGAPGCHEGQRPNKRLKLAARVDYGMNLFSARRSLSAIR